MLKENAERNTIIYHLWEKGETISSIAFETGIPRSTVGYYVRKFNKKAKRGDPIIISHVIEEPNSMTLALQALTKVNINQKVGELITAGDIEGAYKYLMVIKLNKELSGTLFPTKAESQAGMKFLEEFVKSKSRKKLFDNQPKV